MKRNDNNFNNNNNNNFRKEEKPRNNNWNSINRNFNKNSHRNNNNYNGNHNYNSRSNNQNKKSWNNNITNKNDNNTNIEIPENVHEELFIRSIDFKSEEKDIRETFSKYEEIVRCKILRDKEKNKSKGIGFVQFKEKSQAYNEMKDADKIQCQGRKLIIKYSNDKSKENSNSNNMYNKNRNFQNKRNNNFSNNKNKEDNNNDDGWKKKTLERERSREKEVKNEDIDCW